MAMVTCSNCGGRFPQPQRDGTKSVHGCPPLSEAQAFARSRNTTVAKLGAAKSRRRLRLDKKALTFVGMEQDRRTVKGKAPKGVPERRAHVGT